jgi:hypothetical protein
MFLFDVRIEDGTAILFFDRADQTRLVENKLGRYKIFRNDTNTIQYRINYLKVGIFDIDTKKNLYQRDS